MTRIVVASSSVGLLVWLVSLSYQGSVSAFVSQTSHGDAAFRATLPRRTETASRRVGMPRLHLQQQEEEEEQSTRQGQQTRRHLLGAAISGCTTAALLSIPQSAFAADEQPPLQLKRALRPTAFRVDSTQPPTLLPLNAGKERTILASLGKGSGTDKERAMVDTINFNNMLNKAVYGTVDAFQDAMGMRAKTGGGASGSPTFVVLGVPSETAAEDVDFCMTLLDSMTAVRKPVTDPTALGLAALPYSTQTVLDGYVQKSVSRDNLVSALKAAGVAAETISTQLPLLDWAQSKQIDLVALSPEMEDLQMAAQEGLQNVNVERRADYVIDTTGFIALSEDPKFKLYTEKSLLKDYATTKAASPGFYYSQRILAHEAAATALAKYATQRTNAFVAVVAPTPDVRYLCGINGRLPRLCESLGVSLSSKAVTTILLNPSAAETLSASRYLRLEIGTGPATLDYQTKVADYLWFSSIPKVNLLPRIMNN